MNRIRLAALVAVGLAGQAHGELSIVWQHSANNQEVAFSPNSALLATGGGGTNIWRTSNGSLFETLDARFPDSRSVAFSPDGVYLAGGSHSFNQNLNLWRVFDGFLVKGRVTAHNNGVESVRFSPNGQFLATGGRDATTKLWTVPDLTLVRSFPTGARTFSVAFSPDGSRLVTGGQFGVSVWDVGTGARLFTLDGTFTNVESVAYSPNGNLIAAGYNVTNAQGQSVDSSIRIWRTSDGTLLRTLNEPNTLGVQSVAFAPRSDFVVSGGDSGGYPYYFGHLRIWRVVDGALLINEAQQDPNGTGISVVMSANHSPNGAFIAYTRLDGLTTVVRNPFQIMPTNTR